MVVVSSLVATCHIADLVSPGRIPTLHLNPALLLDSARVGSVALRSSALVLDISSAVPWSLRSARGSAWLTPSATAGRAPDTVTVVLDPAGLAQGVYRDTLLFVPSGPTVSPVALPVEFRILACAATDVVPGTAVGD